MKRLTKTVITTLLGCLLASGSNAWAAAGIAGDGVLGDDGTQFMSGVSTYAGLGDFGSEDGAYLQATFRTPRSVLTLADGTVLVSDSRSMSIRRLKDGETSVLAGVSVLKDKVGFPTGGLIDGKADLALFNEPEGLAADGKGDIYVADAGNNAIRKIDASGQVTTLAGDGVPGSTDGKGSAARFNHPRDVAVASDGTVYVADTLNHEIRKIAVDGTVTTLNKPSERAIVTGPGEAAIAGDYADGDLKAAMFNEPSGIALDASGNLYVSDTGNQRIRYIDLAAGTVKTVAGSKLAVDGKSLYESNALYAAGDFKDGPADQALFNFPAGIAVTGEGGLVIADSQNHSVRYLYQGTVYTLAGDKNQFAGQADGVDHSAEMNVPVDVAVAGDGSILVADSFNNRIRQIFMYHLPADLPDDDSYKVVVENKKVSFDAQPEITGDRLMVPVRFIAEALGYTVDTADFPTIRLKKAGSPTVEMKVGEMEVTRIGTDMKEDKLAMDVAPYVKQDRTYVPVRFFAEEIGLDVQWNNEHHTAVLRGQGFIR